MNKILEYIVIFFILLIIGAAGFFYMKWNGCENFLKGLTRSGSITYGLTHVKKIQILENTHTFYLRCSGDTSVTNDDESFDVLNHKNECKLRMDNPFDNFYDNSRSLGTFGFRVIWQEKVRYFFDINQTSRPKLNDTNLTMSLNYTDLKFSHEILPEKLRADVFDEERGINDHKRLVHIIQQVPELARLEIKVNMDSEKNNMKIKVKTSTQEFLEEFMQDLDLNVTSIQVTVH